MRRRRWSGRTSRRLTAEAHAVLGLPLRLSVAVIIGTVALAAIVGFITNPCLFPRQVLVSIDPMVHTINHTGVDTITVTVTVTETDGRPISEALVVITGLQAAASGYTITNGSVRLTVAEVTLLQGTSEGYLDVRVTAPCHDTFSQTDLIKIRRGTYVSVHT
ncbi:MAG: hypothetical protein JXA00_06565 [Candidatus Thermoplasmatota archaeon]|nr:hypothetical protein [Candidatus Thermoplasmatota archaeon]